MNGQSNRVGWVEPEAIPTAAHGVERRWKRWVSLRSTHPTVWLLLILMLLGGLAQAAHITDKLVVGLYAKAELEGEPMQLLTSGMPVEVLEKGTGVLKVRLADDTRGWVESGYVSEEKPARMMLLEAQAELRRLKQSDAAEQDSGEREAELQQQLEKAQQRIERLEQGQAELLAARLSQQKLEVLRERVDQAIELLAQGRAIPPVQTGEGPSAHVGVVERYLPWIVGLVMLVIGFAVGVGFIDYRIRRRYGGFRI